MSLPWFAFEIEKYVKATMRLDRSGHGAYILLMLDYYATETPPPDNDRVLAAITKSTLDEWKDLRPMLEPFFQIGGGVWRHDKIDATIADGHAKHSRRSAHASLAAQTKQAKINAERAQGLPGAVPRAVPERAPRKKPPPGTPAESPASAPGTPAESSRPTQLQEHSLITREREAAAPEGSLSEGQKGLSGKEGQEGQHSIVPKPQPPAAPNPLGTQLPEDWVPSDADIATAEAYGMGAADLEQEVLKFHAKHAGEGTFSKNWPATWQLWCARFKEYHVKNPPKARIEVNSGPYVPTTKDWTAGVFAWARDNGTWPYRKLGPEPGLIGCKCPPEIIRAAGFDPATGLKLERAPS